MRVLVNNRFSVDIDNYGNHTLVEHTIAKNGKSAGLPKETVWGYYSSLPAAVKKIADIVVLDDSERVSLAEYVDRYENAVKSILVSLKGGMKS